MAEFDLIPEDYKYWQWQRGWIKRATGFLLGSFVVAVAAWVFFRTSTNNVNASILDLQREMAISEIQREQLEDLHATEQQMQKQWQLLSALGGGTRVKTILKIIDDSLIEGDVWFLDWHLERLNQPGTPDVIRVSSVPSDVDTQFSINGQARDHSAFSGFVQRLIASEKIQDVKIIKTSLKKVNNINIVDFSIMILISNGPEASHA